MPLFVPAEITNARLYPLYSSLTFRVRMPSRGHGFDQRVPCPWKSLGFPRGRFIIKAVAAAVATIEPAAKGKHLNLALNPEITGFKESEQLDEREKLRRTRISKANKGNTPWNKGRKHSPETLQKIRERTRLAMQNPKVKMKLVNLGHAQTTETRLKIGAGVRMGWERRRGRKMVQETCLFEWQNLIAEASRQGYVVQEELQWNSYETLDEQLKQDWLDSVEQRKQMARTSVGKRAPKPPEQRRKIAEAIAAKWADPEYRERVCSALAKYHGAEAGAEKKPRRRQSDDAQPRKKNPIMKKDTHTRTYVKSGSKIINPIRLKINKPPAYKDPLVNCKLEMIKNIRAQRAAADTEQSQAIAQARLLIAEAEKAAKALEVTATKSSIAQASLVETRKLIAEAIQLLESIDSHGITDSDVPSFALSEINTENGAAFEVLNQSNMVQVNGHNMLSSRDKFSEDFGEFTLEKLFNSDPELHLTNNNDCASFPFSLNSQIKECSPSNQQRETERNHRSECKADPSPTVVGIQSVKDETLSTSPIATKKWVRGRLVEVTEEKQPS